MPSENTHKKQSQLHFWQSKPDFIFPRMRNWKINRQNFYLCVYFWLIEERFYFDTRWQFLFTKLKSELDDVRLVKVDKGPDLRPLYCIFYHVSTSDKHRHIFCRVISQFSDRGYSTVIEPSLIFFWWVVLVKKCFVFPREIDKGTLWRRNWWGN